MKPLWIKIGLGALAVFAFGMLLITLGRQVRTTTTAAVSSAIRDATGQLAGEPVPFVLDSRRIGTVTNLSLRREQEGELPRLQLDVRLDTPEAAGLLKGCLLVPDGPGEISPEGGFRCAASPDGLVVLGEADFTPAGVRREVLVSRQHEAELRRGEAFSLDASLEGGRLQVNAAGVDQEVARLLARAHGARLEIRDSDGRELIRLRADSSGAMLQVRDERGRDVIEVRAGGDATGGQAKAASQP